MNVVEKLELLYGKRTVMHQRTEQINALKESLVPQEIKDKQREIEEEFAYKHADFIKSIADLEEEIKNDVLAAGVSVKSPHLHAVFAKGRVSWDAKGLDGFAAAHPEIEKFKSVGNPTVSIRDVK